MSERTNLCLTPDLFNFTGILPICIYLKKNCLTKLINLISILHSVIHSRCPNIYYECDHYDLSFIFIYREREKNEAEPMIR